MLTRNSLNLAAVLLAAACLANGKAAADQIIPDDLIVQGSLCVGFDCVNGEVFNADTIILKENQLRILFLDTSAAGFPSNDWRLIANDATGSGNLFAIEDVTGGRRIMTLEAGASTNSIFVDSTGRVGFRTSTPVLDLHVNTSNTPALRLEQNNSGGFTAQTWDIGGNEANFFVRDVTGGSKLSFRIRPGAPTSSLDIAANGNVGVGTGSPGAKLHVFGAANADTFAVLGPSASPTGADGLNIGYGGASLGAGGSFFNAHSTAGNGKLIISTDGTTRMTFDNTGTTANGTLKVTTLGANPPGNTVCFGAANVLGTCASDSRLKSNVRYLQESAGLAAVMRLKPATYQWHDGDDRVMAGFIAQEAKAAIPEAVHQPGGSENLSLDSAAILSYAVKAIQEQQREIDELKRRLNAK